MAFGDQDLGVFFGDFGVPVEFGGVTVSGNFDTPASPLGFAGPSTIERQEYSISVPANAFSRLLKKGDTVAVASVAYAVKSRELSLDGLIATYYLEQQ